jgi:hypothetical protein
MVATKPVDFRKGAEGLAVLVREIMMADLFSSASIRTPTSQTSSPDRQWSPKQPYRRTPAVGLSTRQHSRVWSENGAYGLSHHVSTQDLA